MKNIIIVFFFLSFSLTAQDNLLSLINLEEEPNYTSYTFKGTKVVNGQSIELPSSGVLQFNIQHRFGPLNSGSYYLYGLDNAQVRFSLEYGLKDWFCLGIGRSSSSKTIDGNMKLKILRQVTGNKTFPFTLVTNSSIYFNQSTKDQIDLPSFRFTDQLIYVHQVLLARKINRNLSIQFTPTFLHYNSIEIYDNERFHDSFSLGIGGRQKITKRISINGETFIQLYNPQNNNVISFGFDIETGGHVFQLHVSNSPAMIEPLFITMTDADFLQGDIYFGFNISRVFTIKKD